MSNEITTTEEEKKAAALALREERLAMMKSSPEAMKFELMQRKATMYASSDIVPQSFHGKPANCMIALNMAERMGADELAVMQSMVIVHGKPTWESKFLIAMVNACGRFTPLKFKHTGERGKDSWGMVAWAKDKETGEILESTEVTIEMAKAEGWYGKNGSKWKTMPELMLQYRSGAFFSRVYAPDATLGMHSREEMEDVGPKKGFDHAKQISAEELPEDPFTNAIEMPAVVATDATTEEEPQKEGELL